MKVIPSKTYLLWMDISQRKPEKSHEKPTYHPFDGIVHGRHRWSKTTTELHGVGIAAIKWAGKAEENETLVGLSDLTLIIVRSSKLWNKL